MSTSTVSAPSEQALTAARHIAARAAALLPAQIASTCSQRHIQSVIEDLQRDVALLSGLLEAHAGPASVTRLGDPSAPRRFAMLTRGHQADKRWVDVHANDRTHARQLCAQAGLIVYETTCAGGQHART